MKKRFNNKLAVLTEPLPSAVNMDSPEFIKRLDERIEAFGGMSVWNGGWNRVLWKPFDGEKTMGGMGPINLYTLDHDSLRLRSWQLMLESEIVQIGIQRYVMWLIGQGLRLKCEPDGAILKKKGIDVDTQEFAREAESYWNLFANNEISDRAGMVTFQQAMWEAEINALVGGDCVFIINLNDEGIPTASIKDGAHLCSPILGYSGNGTDIVNPKTGYRIRHGIEMDDKGQHIAFWIRKGYTNFTDLGDINNFERVPARDKTTGLVRAFVYYGLRFRLDDVRGIPLIAVCMETTKQLEMYKEATVSGAVERAKIALVVQHELNAVGTNPLDDVVMKAMGGRMADIPADSNNIAFQNTVAGTTSKQAINMPPGSKMVALEGKQEIHFDEFYSTNLTIIFAAIGIPKEVALMLFGNNYSASRASIKDWEHTLIVKRQKNVSPAYNHMFRMFLVTQVLAGEIKAPGYIEAVMNRNTWVVLAYQKCKWVGDNPPNIDELKEVTAARLKMGLGSVHIPFDDPENIIADLGLHGDLRTIMQKYQDMMQYANKLGIEKVEPARTTIEQFGDPDEDKKGKPGNEPLKNQDKGERDSETVPVKDTKKSSKKKTTTKK